MREITRSQFPYDELNISIVIDLGLMNYNQSIKGNEEPVKGATLSKIIELWANVFEQEARNPYLVFSF